MTNPSNEGQQLLIKNIYIPIWYTISYLVCPKEHREGTEQGEGCVDEDTSEDTTWVLGRTVSRALCLSFPLKTHTHTLYLYIKTTSTQEQQMKFWHFWSSPYDV